MAQTGRSQLSDTGCASYFSVSLNDLEAAISAPPDPEPSEVRTLDDMSKAERRKLEKQYGCRIARRRGIV